MRRFADDGAWLSPFAQQTPEQFEHDRCQWRRSWHILVHELLFELTKFINEGSNEEDETKIQITETQRQRSKPLDAFFVGVVI